MRKMKEPHLIKKIVAIGPESTGKSTLAQQLAAYFETTFVPEYARRYIDELDRDYQERDLLNIAKGQIQLEEQRSIEAKNYLFCDTDLTVIKVWSLNAYQNCDEWVLEQINTRKYDLYLLCGIDTPWEYDPQREHPHLRAHFYDIYKNELQNRNLPFIELEGNKEVRLEAAIQRINEL
jgi:NadR type nicotinamide-nucleotide adenylyltransferase